MISEHREVAKCHWHTLVDSVGTCTVCGKTGCSTCLVQEAVGFRCQDCIRKGRQATPASPLQPQAPPAAPWPPAAPGQALTSMPQRSPIPASPPGAQPISPQPARGRFDPRYTKILVSLALFLTGAAIPIQNLTWGQHFVVGYVLWALFWGAPAAWRLGRKLVFNNNFLFLGCPAGAVAWVVTACLLLFGGWLYCLYGGGIYQFLKHWWSMKRTA